MPWRKNSLGLRCSVPSTSQTSATSKCGECCCWWRRLWLCCHHCLFLRPPPPPAFVLNWHLTEYFIGLVSVLDCNIRTLLLFISRFSVLCFVSVSACFSFFFLFFFFLLFLFLKATQNYHPLRPSFVFCFCIVLLLLFVHWDSILVVLFLVQLLTGIIMKCSTGLLRTTKTKLDVGKLACLTELQELRLRGVSGLALPTFTFSGNLSELAQLSHLHTLVNISSSSLLFLLLVWLYQMCIRIIVVTVMVMASFSRKVCNVFMFWMQLKTNLHSIFAQNFSYVLPLCGFCTAITLSLWVVLFSGCALLSKYV